MDSIVAAIRAEILEAQKKRTIARSSKRQQEVIRLGGYIQGLNMALAVLQKAGRLAHQG